MKDGYDLIVIGGGMAGLATGALAASRGLRPLVLEQREAPGGACATLERKGYRFDAGASLLWGFEAGGSLRALVDEVGAPVEALPLEPGFQVAIPGHRLSFYQNPDRFWREIRREFPGAMDGLRAFHAELEGMDAALGRLDLGEGDLPPRTVWQRLRRWRGRSQEEEGLRRRAHEILADLPAWNALPPEVQQVFRMALRHLGHADPSAPVLLAARLLGLLRLGFAAVRGGAGALAAALAAMVERRGGTVRPMVRATEVLLRGRRAAGVRTADGAVLEAPAVVVTVAPGLLAGHLLPERAEAFPDGLPGPATAALTLYLGLDEAILPSEMGPQVLLGPGASLEPGGIETLSISTSPAWESSRAPLGRRALTVTAYVPLAEGSLPAVDWTRTGQRVLDALEDLIPGIRRHLDYCEVRSPLVWQEQTGRPSGAAGYTHRSLPVFLGWQGVPHGTRVSNLFVAGDWTFPGCGVAAVVEGARRTVGLLEASRR
jgi:phytoene dehydrogenase-like protein